MGGLSESIKKEKFKMKIFFSDNVEWSSKNLKKMSANVKANIAKTTRNKRSDGFSYKSSHAVPSKLEINKKGGVFFI